MTRTRRAKQSCCWREIDTFTVVMVLFVVEEIGNTNLTGTNKVHEDDVSKRKGASYADILRGKAKNVIAIKDGNLILLR